MKNEDSVIRDNYSRGNVADFLRVHTKEGADLSIVSAFFTMQAYHMLKKQFNSIKHLRFLFGEPNFLKIDDSKEKKSFKIVEDRLDLTNALQQKAEAKACYDWIEEKVEIKSMTKPDFLHGKLYHIQNANNQEAQAVLGSSNFTVSGLGYGKKPNIELNYVIQDRRDLTELKEWFDEIWEGRAKDVTVVDVKEQVLEHLTRLYANNTPEFIYYKTLFHIFEEYITETQQSNIFDENLNFTSTDIWSTLFKFQKDGVISIINKLKAFNGCILADSVGLGKTYQALAVIKYFELKNDRVLVLCPKKLQENWTVYSSYYNSRLNPFTDNRLNKFAYQVLCHTDLSREKGDRDGINFSTFNWGAFDLVVIDESHNFRNNTKGKKDENGNVITKSRYERLLEDIIKQGAKTKVLLLSATPVNNDLTDLRNQLDFITEGDKKAFADSLNIQDYHNTLNTAQRTFKEWLKKGQSKEKFLMALSSDFFTLLDHLTIARSRRHIEQYYKEEMQKIGAFPERKKPRSVYSPIDSEGMFKTFDEISAQIENYKLAIFSPSQFVKKEFHSIYEKTKVKNFTQSERESHLIGMMKMNFLKRLESSVFAFAITMERTYNKIKALEERIEKFKAYKDQNQKIEFENIDLDDTEDEELLDALQIGEKYVYNLSHLDFEKWLKALRADRKQINDLWKDAKDVSIQRDAKLAQLKQLIQTQVKEPSITKDKRKVKKIVVFTAFADTATYLYKALEDWAKNTLGIHIALVTGGSSANYSTLGKANFTEILTNFSPISKKREKLKDLPQEEEIDLLIATDCISEGQNLQDCNYLINYDIHWNPVRIIQRFGRIDRIGSQHTHIQMVNFWATADLDKYLKLESRVKARMALVDITGTGEDDLLSEEQVHQDLKFRDEQLKRLKDEVLDPEDLEESISLADFSLDDFRIDLVNFIQKNQEALASAPIGLYAVVPSKSDKYSLQAGVIFCLRQKPILGKETIQKPSQTNPLHPYYLVYISEDGKQVLGTFVQAKKILEIFKTSCYGKNKVFQELCDAFDAETNNGQTMDKYDDLLKKAMKTTLESFRKREAVSLTKSRSAMITAKSEKAEDEQDFELITWLLIESKS